VDDNDLPEVEGEFAKSASLTFPLKPGATPPPSPTPEPTEEATTGEEATGDEAAETTEDEAVLDLESTVDDETVLEDPSATPSPSETPSPYIDAPDELQSKVIIEGDGEEIQPFDAVTIYYHGQVWGGAEAFDSNYVWGMPSTLTLGRYPNPPIEGWNRGLVGKKVNSRVLLVIPPADGYGVSGNESAGIGPTDVIVFVVDVVARFPQDASAQADATPTGAQTDLVIEGELGAAVTLTIPAGVLPPAYPTTTVLATGTGEALEEGDTAILQFTAREWGGEDAGDTWTSGMGSYPQYISSSSGEEGTVTAFSGLIGIPAGSRVLIELPAKQDTYQAVAVVVDIAAIAPRGEGLSTELTVPEEGTEDTETAEDTGTEGEEGAADSTAETSEETAPDGTATPAGDTSGEDTGDAGGEDPEAETSPSADTGQ
jgi:peptidylprolyl isomerase